MNEWMNKLLSRSNSPYGLHETETYRHDDAIYFVADTFVADMVVANIDLLCGRYTLLWPISSCCGRCGCVRYCLRPIWSHPGQRGKRLSPAPVIFLRLHLSQLLTIIQTLKITPMLTLTLNIPRTTCIHWVSGNSTHVHFACWRSMHHIKRHKNMSYIITHCHVHAISCLRDMHSLGTILLNGTANHG